MNDKKIEIEIYQHDNFVYGRILKMPDELRNKKEIIEHNGYTLYSQDYPQLTSDCLFLRGTQKNKDHYWFGCTFNSKEEASNALKNIEELIAVYNNQATLTR